MSDFKSFDLVEAYTEYDDGDLEVHILKYVKAKTQDEYILLGVVEDYASDNGLISTEQELSDRFDADIAPLVVEQCGANDPPAMDQCFNDWTDNLCKDNQLHPISTILQCR